MSPYHVFKFVHALLIQVKLVHLLQTLNDFVSLVVLVYFNHECLSGRYLNVNLVFQFGLLL